MMQVDSIRMIISDFNIMHLQIIIDFKERNGGRIRCSENWFIHYFVYHYCFRI